MMLSFLGHPSEQTFEFISYAGIFLTTFVYIGVIITLLIENRNPVKSLSYILILIFLPVVGIIVYFFLGRSQKRKRRFKSKGSSDYIKLKKFIDEHHNHFLSLHKELYESIGTKNVISKLFLHAKQSILTHKNELTLLINGESKYEQLLRDINSAKHHIHIEYYIFDQDTTGLKITEALIKKAQEGLEVRVIYDDFGSSAIGDIPSLLERAGIEALAYDPMRWKLYTNANYRNHRKIIVIDGIIGYIGGINIADKYDNNLPNDVYWRDTSLRIKGHATNLLQIHFSLSYNYCNGKNPFPLQDKYLNFEHTQSEAFVDIVSSGPDSYEPYNLFGILACIQCAQHSIRITNPYLIPNEQLVTSLKLAALSGKKVQIICPSKSDSKFVQWASQSHYKSLLSAGVEIYNYQKGFVHAKTLTVDDNIAMIGTVNLDDRSFYLNFEIAAYVYDKKINEKLRESFENDLKESKKIILKEWEKRPLYIKFVESICRLFSPLL